MTHKNLPNAVKYIMTSLEKHGFEAFIVGGCVRDMVMEKEPTDWDICTSALPNQTKEIFSEHKIIETGLKHGTITLILNSSFDRKDAKNTSTLSNNTTKNNHFEITTYRSDGLYKDFRHPESIEFVKDIKTDLSRRDFTINALAFNPNTGIIDHFEGVNDILNHKIKCVGNADERFQEDALRILRALRFASVFDFHIENETKNAIIKHKGLLQNISMERIAIELNKLLLGDGVGRIIYDYFSVFEEIIPEMSQMKGFDQKNPYHRYDALTHTVKSIDFAPKDIYIRLTMLFHDIGKPICFTEENGRGHFYGHPEVSEKIAFKTLSRLKYDTNTIKIVSELILYHNDEILPNKKNIKKWLNKIGEERFRQLLAVKKADTLAHSKIERDQKLASQEAVLHILNEIIQQEQCFSLKDLAVNGKDLIELGLPEGAEIGKVLNQLLEMVIEEKIENKKKVLLQYFLQFLT